MSRILLFVALAGFAASASAAPLHVCATLPSLGALVREVGGDQVEVTVFAKGTEDPHFVEPRPSFVRSLSRADLLVLNGMELEIGWLPALLPNARNGRVLPGAPGYLDASRAIEPLEVPAGVVDRSLGDVHPYGNPHYLLDPQNGLAVARLIRDKLGELRPEAATQFGARYDDFARRLEQAQQRWQELARPAAGTRAISDHNLWIYFARRFGIELVGTMEPKPGIPPTTRHLQELIDRMRANDVRLILSADYYDPRSARFVAENTGARIATMAHEVGALEGTGDYLAMIDHNVRELMAKP